MNLYNIIFKIVLLKNFKILNYINVGTHTYREIYLLNAFLLIFIQI